MKKDQKIDSYDVWNPIEYWEEYYSGEDVPPDEIAMFQFFVDVLKDANKSYPELLDVGCGPTVHRMAPFTGYVNEIHLADYLQVNLNEVQKWIEGKQDALNWDKFIKTTLVMEGLSNFGQAEIEERKQFMRDKITSLKICDLNNTNPLGYKVSYNLVTTFLCVDSITTSKEKWQYYMHNLSNVVAPGGTLILTALGDSQFYHVSQHKLPSANINQDDIRDVLLEIGFEESSILMQVTPLEAADHDSYADLGSIIMATARKNNA